MTGYQAPQCECGHPVGSHRSAGAHWRYEPQYGICLHDGCTCKDFTPISSRKEPRNDQQDQDHGDRDHPDRPDVAACSRRGVRRPVVLELVHTRARALTTGLACGGALGILTVLLTIEVSHAV